MNRVTALLDRATRATSLRNFGDDSFREGLDILVMSADKEGGLTEQGKAILDGMIVDLLSWRLKIEHCFTEHPEIEDQEVVAPLIGLGLPRTGSTAFSIVLGEDPAFRSIRVWEMIAPCPPPETATEHTDPRIEQARISVEQRQERFPRYKTMMPSTATSPVECQSFMGHDFKSMIFGTFAVLPTYSDWLFNKADLVPTYRYLKRVLKLLQWRCPPNRWRLKNPSHILFIDALNEVFPDARFWQTHRAIEKVIPSVTDLYYELMHDVCPNIDRTYLARYNANAWELGLHRLIAFRDAGNDHRFFDIEFNAFQRDMIGSIRSLYTFLGESLSQEAIERMEAWRLATPRDKHGLHTYDAADFGIDLDQLRKQFSFYAKRFNLEQA